MKSYQTILFDLDGTLTDPGIGITNSVAYALQKYGIETADRQQLFPFIGPPLLDSFQERYGFSEQQAKEAVQFYREYYRAHGIFENRVYDGIEALLSALQRAGKTVLVATSKPEPFAEQILSHFGLRSYFAFVAGSKLDETRTKKAEVIAYALSSAHISDRSAAVMVGDRKYDILGARENGLDSIGVLYGYGSREELLQVQATCIAEAPDMLSHFLLAD